MDADTAFSGRGLAEERKATPHFETAREGKPSKQNRRRIDRVRGRTKFGI